MNLFIGEDEPLVAEHLREIVSGLGHKIVGVEHDAASIIQGVGGNDIELVLLDIYMDSSTAGFQVADNLSSIGIPFMFISAHSDDSTLTEAAKYNPIAYIVKPFSVNQIKATLMAFQNSSNRKVEISSGKTIIQLKLDDILYIGSDSNYCEIFTSEKRHLIRKSLTAVLGELNSPRLQRVNKSMAVNLDKIERITSNKLLLDDQWIPYSKIYYSPENK